MEKTAVHWLYERLERMIPRTALYNIDKVAYLEQAKQMEKQQIIDAGNSCAIKQHLHNEMIDRMSNGEAMVFILSQDLTFGEQYYNEKFNK
jgi:hypothetical protein